MPQIRGLTEVVIWVHNMEESLHFYRDFLGLTVMSPPDFRGRSFFKPGNQRTECPSRSFWCRCPKALPPSPVSARNGRCITSGSKLRRRISMLRATACEAWA